MFLDFDGRFWEVVKDGYADARQIFHRHYSYRPHADGRSSKLFCGPGEKLVLISKNDDALFIWRKFISDNGQTGINCAAFRNESNQLSSKLIVEAERFAKEKWPNEGRLYTYVNALKIRSNNPGCCFIKAGWQRCGVTKVNKLIILEKELRQ